MKFSKVKQTSNKYEKRNFITAFSKLNITMKVISFLGNIGSIFLASFFISKLITDSVQYIDSVVLTWIITLTFLTSLELIKRYVFDNFTIDFIKYKTVFSKNVISLFIFSLSLIGLSFYSSLNGAKEFSNKSELIENTTEMEVKSFSDSIHSEYKEKNDQHLQEIALFKEMILEKNDEQKEINKSLQERGYLYRSEKSRNDQLSDEKNALEEKILILEERIENNNNKKDEIIKNYKDNLEEKASSTKSDNTTNSIIFICISTLIELSILIGIYFNNFYDWKVHLSHKRRLSSDPNYKNWVNMNNILEVLIEAKNESNGGLPSSNKLYEIAKMKGIILTKNEFSSYLSQFNNMNICETKGNTRYLIQDDVTAENIIKKIIN